MRIFRPLLVACVVLPQVNCAADILPWPGFESQPEIFSYAEQLPAAEVDEQVRCELAEFLRNEQKLQENEPDERKLFLDPNKGAQVQLKLTTDLQGSVTYLGINLASLGLDAIASLVTTANNTPSLQLKAQGKTTQTSQVDFVIPQTTDDVVYKGAQAAKGKTLALLGDSVKKSGETIADLSSVTELSKAVTDLRGTVAQIENTLKAAQNLDKFADFLAQERKTRDELQDAVKKLHDQLKQLNTVYDRNDAVYTIGMEISRLGKNVAKLARADPYFDVTKLPQAVALPLSLRLPPDNGACSHGDPRRFLEYKWFRLWLSKALQQYKTRLLVKEDYRVSDQTFADGVCQPKLTITTQFQLLFDVSAGTSILRSIPIILPISGLNIDASPDYTHFIQIIFSLRPYGRYDQFGVTPLDEPTKQRIDACSALQITTNPPASAR